MTFIKCAQYFFVTLTHCYLPESVGQNILCKKFITDFYWIVSDYYVFSFWTFSCSHQTMGYFSVIFI